MPTKTERPFPFLKQMLTTRPEDEILLSCARTCMNQEETERIRSLIQENTDWSYLIEMALRHGVMPLLYRSLNTMCPDSVPGSVLSELRNYFHANTLRNMVMTNELCKILRLFESHQISAIPYKGPVLAASIYGDISLRQFCDLDIMIHERDIMKAKVLLNAQGYRPEVQLTRAQERAFLRFQRDYKFLCNEKGVFVEIQWGIAQRYFPVMLDAEQLWERCETVSIDGENISTFSPEDLILILCVHGFYHCWERVEWICDVAEFIRVHREIDWFVVLEQARAQGCERILLLGLLLARDLLSASLPEDVSQKIKADRLVKSLAGQLGKMLFSEPDSPRKALECFLFHMRMCDRLSEKFRYCLGRVMTPNAEDWARLPLPAFLSCLYYLLRPLRLFKTYVLRSRL